MVVGMLELIEKAFNTNKLTKEEIIYLLQNLKDEERQTLFAYALETKKKHYGNEVYLRGLIEFSNHCRQDCLYCGIRASNPMLSRYRLTPEEILVCCQEGYNLGYRTFVLQSGEDLWYTKDIIVKIIRTIKDKFPGVAITLSIGERKRDEYEAYFRAGADRFLMRHETASERLYSKLHPTMKLENRRACLQVLKEIGYQMGAGFMVGLPGQSHADLAEDLCYLQELEPDMVGIGPFIPHSETPLKGEKGGTVEDTLVMVALTRLLLPESLLPAATAMGTLHPQGRELALQAGANVVMPLLTPSSVRKLYELYQNKICLNDESGKCRYCIERRINSVGMAADLSRGDSSRFIRTHELKQKQIMK